MTGIAVYPRAIDDRLVYFRPDRQGNLFARPVSADPRTGSDRWVSDPVLFRSNLAHCGRDLCLQLRWSYDSSSIWVRFDPRQGFDRPERRLPAGSRQLGDGVLDLGGEPEVLAGFDEDGVRWRLPVTEAFSPVHSSDGGWYLVTQDGAVLGSLGTRPPDELPDRWEVDLATSMTAGIDARRGELLWKDRGSSFACDGTLAVAMTDGAADDDHAVHPLRCRLRGTMVYGRDVPDAERVRDLDVVVERFDPRSGRVVWSVPLGAAPELVVGAEDLPVASDRAVVITTGAGPRVLDVVSGQRRPPPPDEVVWCSRSAEFRYREPHHYDGVPLHERRGGILVAPCRPDRSISATPPTIVPTTIGAHRGARAVIATPDGLVAYDRTDQAIMEEQG